MHSTTRALAAILCASIAAASAVLAAAAGTDRRVTIETGALGGLVKDGIVAYLGIPYAAPPVGNLRWRAPERAATWEGVRAADQFGNDCVQHRQYDQPQREDCLYLNVWVPAHAAGRRLPVMVWIYGGGLSYGSAAWPWYDGSAFARQDIVLVSFNYRLARFGFFAHPAVSAETPSAVLGNYGFMDQIAALQWVQRNIAAFGGDRHNVTIFGESAGGRSVNAMLVSPLARGLFHKAIIESGAGRSALRHIRGNRPDAGVSAEALGVEFATSAGLTNATSAALRALPADVVRGPAGNTPPPFANAMIDGRLVVEDFTETYKKGAQHQVPLMIGANSAEFGTGAPPEPDAFFRTLGGVREKALALYDGYGTREPKLIAMEIMSDMGMNNGTRYVARLIAKAGKPVFFYHFGYVTESARATTPAARHAAELVYVFDTPGTRTTRGGPPVAIGDADRKAARQMNAYWARFATTGNPNGTGLPRWPAYTLQNDAVLEFTMNEGPVARQNFKAAKMAFWDALYDAGFRPGRGTQ
jgi:para-nitrobenzyl esterase